MHLLPIQDFPPQNMHVIKKIFFFDRKIFKLKLFSKVFPNVVPPSWIVVGFAYTVRCNSQGFHTAGQHL